MLTNCANGGEAEKVTHRLPHYIYSLNTVSMVGQHSTKLLATIGRRWDVIVHRTSRLLHRAPVGEYISHAAWIHDIALLPKTRLSQREFRAAKALKLIKRIGISSRSIFVMIIKQKQCVCIVGRKHRSSTNHQVRVYAAAHQRERERTVLFVHYTQQMLHSSQLCGTGHHHR